MPPKHLFLLLLLAVCLGSSSVHPYALSVERPSQVAEYIRKYQYLARELRQSTGLPVPIILAVAGLESNWGRSELAKSANNHFGIKTKVEWQGLVYCKKTVEYQGQLAYHTPGCFRQYRLIRDSYQDFGQFVRQGDNYRHLSTIPQWNYRDWLEGLHQAGYATDPIYADKVMDIIWRYEIYKLVEE